MPIAFSDNATVTVSMHDWRKLERQIKDFEDQQAKAHTSAPAQPESDRVRDLREALDAALPVVQWAVGQLNPESHRGWPHASLKALGEKILVCYADDADRETLAITFREFSQQAANIEYFRAERSVAARSVVKVADGTAQTPEDA